jgi:hypothetical protein
VYIILIHIYPVFAKSDMEEIRPRAKRCEGALFLGSSKKIYCDLYNGGLKLEYSYSFMTDCSSFTVRALLGAVESNGSVDMVFSNSIDFHSE